MSAVPTRVARKPLMVVLAATDDHLQALQHYGHSHDLRQAMGQAEDLIVSLRACVEFINRDVPMDIYFRAKPELQLAQQALARATGEQP
jgi:hypothetical protein